MQQGFFKSVWEMVRRIPQGKVATYGQIAALLGNPRAARTVGWALHSMPDDANIPWHRVINAKGRISTDCLEHSPDLQRRLLEAEEILFDERGYVDLKMYQWRPELAELPNIQTD